jgi:transcriptional regulator with XRE-family HTH domain
MEIDNEYILYQLGRNIRFKRQKNHYSQIKLAELCEINQSAISDYENAKDNMTFLTLARIAKALGISPEELLRGVEI